jgi:uncharacterized protein (TIGR02001 family)
MKKTIISFLLASAIGAGSVFAEDASVATTKTDKHSNLDIKASSTVAYESEYVFRGIKQYEQAVQPSLDISTPVYEGDAYIGYWGSFAGSNTDTKAYSENDAYIGYTQSLSDMYTMDTGYTHYMYEDLAQDTWDEIYLGFSADYMDLSPSIYGYWNFALEGFVVETSIGKTLDTSSYVSNTSIDLGAHLGLNTTGDANGDDVAGTADDSYTYWGLTSDVVYALNDVASAKLGVRYGGNNNSKVGGLNVDPQEDLFWWGVSTTFGF